MTSRREPIVVEATFGAPPDRVWQALTDPKQMVKWYFDSIEGFEPKVGAETRFSVHAEGEDYLHVWRVTDASPQERLGYTFDYEGYDGSGHVLFELTPTDDGTRLRVTHRGLDTFPDIPIFSREAGEGAWIYFLQERLAAYLAA